MGRVDRLLAQLTPDGVVSRSLGELVERIVDGSHNPPKASLDGTGRMLSAKNVAVGAVDLADARMLDPQDFAVEDRRTQARRGDVLLTIVGAIGRSAVIEFDEPVVFQRSVCVIRPKPELLLPKYLHYTLQTTKHQRVLASQANGGAQKGIYLNQLSLLQIPVPPLEVQTEIVRILEHFAELARELEAEFEARRAQFAFYRDELLASSEVGARWVALGDAVTNLDSQRRPVTRSDRQAGQYPYYGANGVQDFVNAYIFDGTFLLMGEDGSVVQRNGAPVLNWATGKIWVNNHAHVLVEKSADLRLRFLFHYLQTADISSFVTGGTQPKLNQANMNRIQVPVPSIADQDRIIGILDLLDTFVNDISVGLPAELSARRKQYEYYRDKLLTFKEAAA